MRKHLTFLSNFPYKPKQKAKNLDIPNKNTIYTQTIYYVEKNVVCSSKQHFLIEMDIAITEL